MTNKKRRAINARHDKKRPPPVAVRLTPGEWVILKAYARGEETWSRALKRALIAAYLEESQQ